VTRGSASRPRAKKRRAGAWLLAVALALGAAALDSNTRIDVREYALECERLPAAFDGFRVTSLSDVHAAQFGEGNKRLISAVEKTRPDIIAITGDLIDDAGQLGIVDTLVSALTDIAPVYYVTGNHEWDSGDITNLFSVLEQRGVTVLRNEYVKLERGDSSVIILGVDDPNSPANMPSPGKLIDDIRAAYGECMLIALEHRNNRLDLYASLGADIVLCGHAHGGMVRLPFTDGLVGPQREFLPTYTDGVYIEGKTAMLVSRGLGNHTGYPRLFNNPHLPVAVLRSPQAGGGK
jgi:predicted MPP superfamily phosphohydrolase